ncbi:DUF4240 domain-containing protein [Nocardia sp. CA-119907]|uniref:DUF4240 domain-containing protein n=1 Tax=Nocardia sp. CA-119907 TaxID=3239973 RepID=UPI003D99DB92
MAVFAAVSMDEFWSLVESALAGHKPAHEALVDRLIAGGSLEAILDFQERLDAIDAIICRWDIWAAAYLIGGGCSDDSFTDFRAGVIALGRDWFERVTESPDSLADHPAVIKAAAEGNDYTLFYEMFGFVCATAYARLANDECSFWETLEARQQGAEKAEHDMGEKFEFDDTAEMHARLPRLAALFLGER